VRAGVCVVNVHFLKCHAENFDAIVSGAKRFEVRHEDDRTFAVGDRLCLIRTDVDGVRTNPSRRTYVDVLWLTRHAGPLVLCGVDVEGGGAPTHVAVMSIGAMPEAAPAPRGRK
jgi:hypothetical protein